ncbi:hypothetical protein OHT57_42470 [Streptomyces sp. NBC_00285]|uniref:hypothetical protein n=1 Tax=Streptomyces sp. NBC_00285 TaxID=2975700 RepID=UPI00324816F8
MAVGPGQEYGDPYGDRARPSEIADAGALLVRPGGFVALRHASAATDAGALLPDAP